MRLRTPVLALALATTLAACQSPNEIALKVGAEPSDSPALRSAEVRDIPVADDVAVLRAATSTLQDLGFTVTESAPQVGVLAGTKSRDATTTGQIAGAVVMGLLFGASAMRYDKSQQINVTFVVAPGASLDSRTTRVSFDRYLTNNQGQLWRTGLVTDPKIYAQFYEALDKAVALEKGFKS